MKILQLSLYLLLFAPLCFADSGVIIPSDKQAPDASVLAIESMRIHVGIDNGHATVRLQEVFHNKTGRALEGTYSLALPDGAAISDFAVWDDITRIPGVILERRRASELYQDIRNQSIDPGLLESGEVSDSEAPGQARHSNEFTVKIVPIPAYGYKRLEVEYRQDLSVTQLTAGFQLPLKPVTYAPQTAAMFSLDFELRSGVPVTDLKVVGQSFPLKINSQDSHTIKGSFDAANFAVNDDFSITYRVGGDSGPVVQAYHENDAASPGFFETSAILSSSQAAQAPKPYSAVFLFDTSLSMQWEKLERSFQVLETALRALRPGDKFDVIVFNSDVQPANKRLVSVSTGALAKALDFVRASRLRGGTNLQAAFNAAFSEAQANTYVVLISDGSPTEGPLSSAKFNAWLDKAWAALPRERQPRLYAFAVGNDADVRLMKGIAKHGGVYAHVGSAESLDYNLSAFVKQIGIVPLDNITLTANPSSKVSLVYRLGDDNSPGGMASWVGQYAAPGPVDFTVSAAAARQTVHSNLPGVDTSHPYLPVSWARARVDALLEKIDREGEDKASIDEIIRLSRKYKFVTPYTSFLAAPRALLRPRLIRPGDPMLRVRTDPSIASVTALFPFGSIKPLRFIKDENIWQTRFVAPDNLPEGAHVVRLILRDANGHVYREEKTFVISSQPPLVRVHLASNHVRAGQQVALHVQASRSTRTIAARLYGAPPLFLRWDESTKTNSGILTIPTDLPPGRYSVHVTAEDIAHNISHQEVPLEILPY